MACTEGRHHQLGELAGGRLDVDVLDELLDHVEGCAACSLALDHAAALVAAGAARSAMPGHRAWSWAAAAGVLAALGLALAARQRPADLRSLADLRPLVPQSSVLRSAPDETAAAWEQAMERYRAGDWHVAADLLAALAAGGDERALVGLYEGLARLQLGELERGAAVLEGAAARDDGLVRQRCLWYAAQARLALGDGPSACALLERLVALDGEFAPNARALLDRVAARLGDGP